MEVGVLYWPRLGGKNKSARETNIMHTTIETSSVLQKTKELCQTILDQPEYAEQRERIEAFLSDEAAKQQYQHLSDQSEALQHKQQQGVEPSPSEIAQFEKLRENFFNNPVAAGFMDAQRQMHKVQETVNQYLSKTFELSRVPEADDLDSGGSCGHGCGCHH